MWPFRTRRRPKAWLPPANADPVTVPGWTDEEIAAMSKAIRVHGQPDSEGWRRHARMCLDALSSAGAVEHVARTIETTLNSGLDPDRAVLGSHYMHGMPAWCVWIETARPAVDHWVKTFRIKRQR
jgi:hypothetical protein